MIQEYTAALRHLSRDVRLYLFSIALLGFTVFGGIHPVLFNLYLLRLGYGPAQVGLISSVSSLAFALFSVPAGLLSRRWGGRRTMVRGMGLAVATFLLLPLVEWMPTGVGTPTGAGLAWLVGCTTLRSAGFATYWVNGRPFVMQATGPGELKHVYSLQAALFPLAGFAGSLLAGWLPGWFGTLLGRSLDGPAPYRWPVWLVSVLLLPAWAALAAIHDFDAPQDEPAGADGDRAGKANTGRARAAYTAIALLSICIMLQLVGQGVAVSFFTVYMDDGLRAATPLIGTVAAAAQLLSAMAALLLPRLSRRIGSGGVSFWGTLGMAAGLLPLALIPHWGAASVGHLILVLFGGVTLPAIDVYQMELVAPQWRTTMSGATAAANGLSFAIAAYAGGRIIDAWGYTPFYGAAAAATAAGALLFWACFERQGKMPRRPY